VRLREAFETRTFFLVFDRGDEIVDTIRRFAEEHRIRGGSFTALGGAESATIAFWNPATKAYENRQVDEQCEVGALVGNIGFEWGEEGQHVAKVHAHIVLGRREGNAAISGHLVRAVVFPTLEMHVVAYDVEIERRVDPETKLSLVAGE
jgi:uncharacterized protein